VTGISFPKKDAEFVARDQVVIQAKRALGAVNVKCSFRCCTEEGYYDGYQQRHFALLIYVSLEELVPAIHTDLTPGVRILAQTL
jgi:hypothetical protein